MTKVQIAGLREDLDETLAALYRAGEAELVPAHRDERLGLDALPEREQRAARAESARAAVVELDGLLRLAREEAGLAVGRSHGPGGGYAGHAAGIADVEEAARPIRAVAGRLDSLRDERALLARYVEPLERVLPLLPELADLDEDELAAIRLDTLALVIETEGDALVELLRDELEKRLGACFELAARRTDPETVVCLLAYPHDGTGAVHELLAHERIRHMALPERFERLSLRGALAAMRGRLAELQGEIEAARGELRALIAPRLEAWQAARAALLAELDQIDARGGVGVTGRAFVVTGWVPEARLEPLRTRLEGELEAPFALEPLSEPHADTPPVLLANVRPVRPFEALVRLFQLPRAGTLDPSPLLAFFLPLMFGVMVGDVVYGLLLLVLAVWLARRFAERSPVVAAIARIAAAGAVWAILFGFLFGEALGNFARRYMGMEPLWFYRGSPDAIEPLFLFVLGLGGAHVVLGLLLGIRQALRARASRELLDRGATLAVVAGVFTLGGTALAALPQPALWPGLALVGTGLALMVWLNGGVGPIMGPVELAGAVGNVLSYLRLGAVGLASVYLAIVANEFAVAVPLAIGLFVAFLLHALNLALAGFSPMIQALRLHYVEFFSKFYEGGGRPFKPFGARREPALSP